MQEVLRRQPDVPGVVAFAQVLGAGEQTSPTRRSGRGALQVGEGLGSGPDAQYEEAPRGGVWDIGGIEAWDGGGAVFFCVRDN